MSFNNVKKLAVVALSGAMLFTGCGRINTNATLVTVTSGDTTETITLGYGNFVARYNQALYDMYYGSYMGEDMWTEDMTGSGSSMQEETKESVLDEMETWYVSKQNADTYGVSISSEDETAIGDAAKAFIEANSQTALDQMGATEEYVKRLLTDRTYASRVQAAIEQEAEGEIEVTDDEAKQSTFSYFLFEKEEENAAAVTADAVKDAIEQVESGDDSAAEAKAANEEALANAKKVASAENFEKAGEDAGATLETYSYTTKADPTEDGGMDAAVIEAAKKLSEGKVSDVIDTDSGYYVIRLDKKYDKEATETKREELKNTKISEYYDDIVEGWKGDITWTVDEKAWEKVRFEERFTNGAEAAGEAADASTDAEKDLTEEVQSGEEVVLDDEAAEEGE